MGEREDLARNAAAVTHMPSCDNYRFNRIKVVSWAYRSSSFDLDATNSKDDP